MQPTWISSDACHFAFNALQAPHHVLCININWGFVGDADLAAAKAFWSPPVRVKNVNSKESDQIRKPLKIQISILYFCYLHFNQLMFSLNPREKSSPLTTAAERQENKNTICM